MKTMMKLICLGCFLFSFAVHAEWTKETCEAKEGTFNAADKSCPGAKVPENGLNKTGTDCTGINGNTIEGTEQKGGSGAADQSKTKGI